MKNINILIGLIFIVNISLAKEFSTFIYEVEENEHSFDVLSLEDGRVYQINKNKNELIETVIYAKDNNLPIELTVTESDRINISDQAELVLAARLISDEREMEFSADPIPDKVFKNALYGFDPSNIQAKDKEATAKEIFKSLNANTRKKSQCFNRAYVWAHELHQSRGIKSKKNFIFYTKKYRREIDKKWWFHVAPVIVINGEEVFLDREFNANPKSREEWETFFIKRLKKRLANHRCPMIQRMSTYDQYTETDWCFHLEASMYFWGPKSLRRLESDNVRPTKWKGGILKTARKEAFKNWRSIWY